MLIAEELGVPLDRVRVGLADARPELLFNQLTGASNTTIATYTPIRVAAAVARTRLLRAGALELGVDVDRLRLVERHRHRRRPQRGHRRPGRARRAAWTPCGWR